MTFTLTSMIERRLLINYRMDAALARTLLPAQFRPQLVRGQAVAGICLIRLAGVRPAALPWNIGWRGENAAHRIAVEWDGPAGTETGVFITERHSGSWLPVLAGGRVFPGVHRHARFTVSETDSHFKVGMSAEQLRLQAELRTGGAWHSELFDSPQQASDFFRKDRLGWSAAVTNGDYEGLTLHTEHWRAEAAEVLDLHSSYFASLPTAAVVFDSALLMRQIPVRWAAHRADAELDAPVGLS